MESVELQARLQFSEHWGIELRLGNRLARGDVDARRSVANKFVNNV